MEQPVGQRLLRLVGLGIRSRGAVVGVAQVREAAKRDKLAVAVVASDASPHSVAKVVPLLEARRIPVIRLATSAELGQAAGREHTAAVGIIDRQLARGIRALLDSAPDGDGRRKV